MDNQAASARVLERDAFGALLTKLAAGERTVIGPTRRDGAIVYREITDAADLPAGWGDTQAAGTYRLRRRDDRALFGHAVGPDSWKRYLHPPKRRLWRARQTGQDLHFEPDQSNPRFAFLGVRACELAAIETLDRVLIDGPYPDRAYQSARENTLIVAVNCAVPAATCFCASMQTGPEVKAGYDVCLTELVGDEHHQFLIETGSQAGEALLDELPTRPSTPADWSARCAVVGAAKTRMGRQLETDDLPERLAAQPNHPRWDEVAGRCLACANCTMVCPTCFCSTVEDHTDLASGAAERVQVWDSCFTGRFAELSGGQVRESTRGRYRQWLTHKLSSWHEQFGMSGCVGCGRCIAWCPAAIDITEEAAAIAAPVGEPTQ